MTVTQSPQRISRDVLEAVVTIGRPERWWGDGRGHAAAKEEELAG